jgi:S-adenosylmethionine hydrolase
LATAHIVGPDNGFASDLLTAAGTAAHSSFTAIEAMAAKRETSVQERGATFHGRDIFAPVAAAIAKGASAAAFGSRVDGVVMRRDIPSVSVDGNVISGRGRYVDRFGNVLTDIPAALVERVFGERTNVDVAVGGRLVGGLHRTYAQRGRGELMALVNSWGLVEAAVNGGRAVDALGSIPASSIRFELARAALTHMRIEAKTDCIYEIARERGMHVPGA